MTRLTTTDGDEEVEEFTHESPSTHVGGGAARQDRVWILLKDDRPRI